ncbi:tetratricopeptide repeat protein [Fulvivirga ulvae]|uniref:tetratricopeptide repeat protein n=1 Tax=Fulvivirga ulvae TaxID=2904245 RepID=UPI001F41CCF8|nr:tetratricopeptide repeat protein [Fulvivirga ulvae]UII33860.1 tetratricopeptide repeat protein [Fulvivirga ulvae]
MKYVFTTIVTVLLFVACNSEIAEPSTPTLPEDIKQLEALLVNESNDVSKLSIYNALYKAHNKVLDMTAAYHYLALQRQLAVRTGDYLVAGKSCYNMGLIKKGQRDYIKAIDLYLEAIGHLEKIKDTLRIAVVLDNIGSVFVETGNYEYAKKFYQRTGAIHYALNETKNQLIADLNLGLCYFATSQPKYDSARLYFESALTLANELTENKLYYLNRIYNQMGTMYYHAKHYPEAVDNYLKSLRYTDVAQEEQQAIGFANIGEVYMEQGLYKEAGKWLGRAMTLSNQMENSQRIAGLLNILGRLYQLQGDHEQGVQYLEHAIEEADKDVINEHLQESLRLIRQSYVALRKAGKPVNIEQYENVLLLDAMQDLLEEEMVDKTNFKALQAALGLSVELDNEKKQKTAEIQLNSRYGYAVIVLFALVVITGAILFTTSRKIYKIRQVLEW